MRRSAAVGAPGVAAPLGLLLGAARGASTHLAIGAAPELFAQDELVVEHRGAPRLLQLYAAGAPGHRRRRAKQRPLGRGQRSNAAGAGLTQRRPVAALPVQAVGRGRQAATQAPAQRLPGCAHGAPGGAGRPPRREPCAAPPRSADAASRPRRAKPPEGNEILAFAFRPVQRTSKRRAPETRSGRVQAAAAAAQAAPQRDSPRKDSRHGGCVPRSRSSRRLAAARVAARAAAPVAPPRRAAARVIRAVGRARSAARSAPVLCPR